MNKKIIVITAHIECFMCPKTIVGRTDDGCTIYARYRWGHFTVRIDPRDPAPHAGAGGRWIVDKQLDPNGLEGSISYEEIKEITSELVEWPAELSPKIYDEGEESSWLDLLE